jgi:predicted  nucleic acid-binding Zn-ribbon protein
MPNLIEEMKANLENRLKDLHEAIETYTKIIGAKKVELAALKTELAEIEKALKAMNRKRVVKGKDE